MASDATLGSGPRRRLAALAMATALSTAAIAVTLTGVALCQAITGTGEPRMLFNLLWLPCLGVFVISRVKYHLYADAEPLIQLLAALGVVASLWGMSGEFGL